MTPLKQPFGSKRLRESVRAMMATRCSQPGSPIPPEFSRRVADWILTMVAFRAKERVRLGKERFPDEETLTEDIANSANSIELLFVVSQEEVAEKGPAIFIAQSIENGQRH